MKKFLGLLAFVINLIVIAAGLRKDNMKDKKHDKAPAKKEQKPKVKPKAKPKPQEKVEPSGSNPPIIIGDPNDPNKP